MFDGRRDGRRQKRHVLSRGMAAPARSGAYVYAPACRCSRLEQVLPTSAMDAKSPSLRMGFRTAPTFVCTNYLCVDLVWDTGYGCSTMPLVKTVATGEGFPNGTVGVTKIAFAVVAVFVVAAVVAVFVVAAAVVVVVVVAAAVVVAVVVVFVAAVVAVVVDDDDHMYVSIVYLAHGHRKTIGVFVRNTQLPLL